MESREQINANEVGSMEKVFGKDDPMFQETIKDDFIPKDLTDTQEQDPGYDAAIMADGEEAEKAALEVDRPIDSHPEEGTQKRNDPYERRKEIPVEVDITHLKHPVTGKIFPINGDIVKQKHLIPCDENGKKVHDSRIFNQRFN